MKLRALFFGLVLSATTLAATDARADDPPKEEELPRRTATFSWEAQAQGKPANTLTATFSYKDVLDGMNEKLASGLPMVIAMRAYVFREGETKPVALAVRTCKVSYDLWEDVYRIRLTTASGEQSLATPGIPGVTRNCAEVTKLPVADRALLTAGKAHFVGVIVEVNPIDAAQLEAMRQWISRPAGSTGIGPGDALFGAVVGVFAKQIGKADKTLRFRTPSVTP